jgi:hypothetical protein
MALDIVRLADQPGAMAWWLQLRCRVDAVRVTQLRPPLTFQRRPLD